MSFKTCDLSELGFLTSESVELPEEDRYLSEFTREYLLEENNEIFIENLDDFLRNLDLDMTNYSLNNFKELYTISSMLTQKYLNILL